MLQHETVQSEIPRALESYPSAADQSLAAELAARVHIEPFNAVATGVFLVAILHTFAATRFAALAHRVQHRHDARAHAAGRPGSPSLAAELLHFLGEVEVVFGLWAVVLFAALAMYGGWDSAKHYFSDTVNYYAGATVRQPLLFGLRLAPSLTLFSERYSELDAYLRRTTIGGVASVTRETRPRTPLTLAYQLEYGRTQAADAAL